MMGSLVDECAIETAKVSKEAALLDVFPVDAYFVRPDHFGVVGLGVGLAAEQVLLIAVLHRGRARDTGPYTENDAILTLEPVGIAGHIGAGPDEAHVAHEHVPQLGEFIDLCAAPSC